MSNRPREVHVLELNGPSDRRFFDIPLDYFGTMDGALAGSGTLGAARLPQRITYRGFDLRAPTQADAAAAGHRVHELVLAELAGQPHIDIAIIWWRRRPRVLETSTGPRWRCILELGTSPTLAPSFWAALGAYDLGSLRYQHPAHARSL